MDKYRLLYIDDDIDTALSEYLDKKLPNSINSTDLALECNELQFIPSEGYKSLLNNASVLTSNIILIDSRLFEDRTASEGKFSGEEFKIILKKYYPFIEVIVITQNGADESVKTLPKYSPDCGKTPDEYYDSVLPRCVNEAIEQNRIYRNLAKRMSENDSWEPILKEKVIGTLEGTGTYDELTKEDIDTLVRAFREIMEKCDG